MARAATTSDAFNAVAEPRRRAILNYIAFKDAARKASPILLEPIMFVEVVTPEDYMGDVIGDLNSRRGQVQGMDQRGNAQAIRPLHEWTSTFERYWRHQLSRVKERAERKNNPSNDGGPEFTSRRKNDLDSSKN